MTKNKGLFAEWLAVPKKMREPKTQKELASLLNIQPISSTQSAGLRTPQGYRLAYSRTGNTPVLKMVFV